MTLKPGWYLVGRHDGSVEPFFVEMRPYSVAIVCGRRWEGWWGASTFSNYWWERQEIPNCVPKSWPKKKAR